MTKRTISIVLAAAIIATISGAGAQAATMSMKAGGPCATAGAITTIGAKGYICTKVLSGKLVWVASTGTSGVAGAKPQITGGGREGGGPDEGGTADIARHAAMKKYSDCLVSHGGTAITLGGPGGPGGDDGKFGKPGTQPSMSAAQKKAMTSCAALAPKFPGPGDH